MAYEELDSWIDANAPNLNKQVLHTQVASIAGGSEGGGMTVIEIDPGSDDNPPFIPNGASVTKLITSGTPVVFYIPGGGEQAYSYAYPGMLIGLDLCLFTVMSVSDSSVTVLKFRYNDETDIWELGR